MISEEVLGDLLSRSESSTIDFKSVPHRIDNDHFKSEFIKDILAMANTPREESAYIVIGVKLHPDGSRDCLGVAVHPDDADLQPIVNRAKVDPKPLFVYQPIELGSKSYGVIEIPVSKTGPYYATRDYGVLEACRLYIRRGTTNDEATPQEQREVYRWFLNESEGTSTPEEHNELQIPHWDELTLACHHFDESRLYLLVLGPESSDLGDAWKFMARLPLSVVLDFDPATADDGVYSVASQQLQDIRSLHLWTLGNESTMVPTKACYWYAARGLAGRESSLVTGDWRQWNRKYGSALQRLLEHFVKSASGRPLTVICVWYAPEYVREICGATDRLFGDSANYVFVTPEAKRYENLASQFGGDTIPMTAEDLLHGIAHYITSSSDDFAAIAGVPSADGGFRVLSSSDLSWLSEDLEVLHSSIELRPSGHREVGTDYLRGATIDWADLAGHFDTDRDKTPQIQALVERELNTRTARRLNLYHWPGSGGSTVARRIAWNLRRRYPVVMLRRVTTGETVSRFRTVFRETGLSTLAVVEGADAVPDRLEQLYTELRTENIPVVFLSVLRRFSISTESERTVFLGQNLSLPEAYQFAETYKRAVPQKANLLDGLLQKGARERTPFQFALTAYGRDYVGITRYVQARLEASNPTQRELLIYLALAYYYGHRSVLPQIFATHLGQSENRPLRLERILDEPQLELTIQEANATWRPVHQLIAEEILRTALSGDIAELRNWRRNLPTWALGFIRVCSKGALVPSDDLLDLLRRVFILRDEHELLGTEGSGSSQFARLIEDVQTDEGKLSILRELVKLFPQEAHFWGHLGRFYSNVMEEQAQAIEALDRAIRLSPNDPVLYHMQGMCYRQTAYFDNGTFVTGFSDVGTEH